MEGLALGKIWLRYLIGPVFVCFVQTFDAWMHFPTCTSCAMAKTNLLITSVFNHCGSFSSRRTYQENIKVSLYSTGMTYTSCTYVINTSNNPTAFEPARQELPPFLVSLRFRASSNLNNGWSMAYMSCRTTRYSKRSWIFHIRRLEEQFFFSSGWGFGALRTIGVKWFIHRYIDIITYNIYNMFISSISIVYIIDIYTTYKYTYTRVWCVSTCLCLEPEPEALLKEISEIHVFSRQTINVFRFDVKFLWVCSFLHTFLEDSRKVKGFQGWWAWEFTLRIVEVGASATMSCTFWWPGDIGET